MDHVTGVAEQFDDLKCRTLRLVWTHCIAKKMVSDFLLKLPEMREDPLGDWQRRVYGCEFV